MILYFTYWFPPSHRSRIVAGFMAAIPVSIGLGAPISTVELENLVSRQLARSASVRY